MTPQYFVISKARSSTSSLSPKGRLAGTTRMPGVTFDDALYSGAMIHIDQSDDALVDVANLEFDYPVGHR